MFDGMKKILIVLVLLLLAGCASKPQPVAVYSVRDVFGKIGAADEYAVGAYPEVIRKN